MLGLVAGMGLSLALTRIHFLIGIAVTVLCILLVAALGGAPQRKRAIIYGAVGGVGCVIAAAVLADWAGGGWPGRRGLFFPAFIHYIRPYAFPIGGYLGALAGCVYAEWRRLRGLSRDE